MRRQLWVTQGAVKTWMRWNDNSIILSHVRTRKMRVWPVSKCARCGVLSTSVSSRRTWSASCLAFIAKETLEDEHLPIQGKRWSIVPWSRDLPGKTRRERDGDLSWQEYNRHYSKRQPGHDQRIDHRIRFLKCSPDKPKRERYEGCLEEKIDDERSGVIPEYS